MKRLLFLTETTAACLLLLVVGLVALNVLLRSTIGVAVPDWFDGSRFLLGVAMLWGVAITTYRGGHINVDLLWEFCGPSNRRRIDIAAAFVVMLFFGATTWMIWQKVADTGSQVTADLRLPLVVFFSAAALGVTATAVLSAVRLVHLVTGQEIEVADKGLGHES